MIETAQASADCDRSSSRGDVGGRRTTSLTGGSNRLARRGATSGAAAANRGQHTRQFPDTPSRRRSGGRPPGEADPYNAVDAIYSTARYLRASGAPGSYYKALFAYNHADWYVKKVQAAAKKYH